jgi:hypothetical protein
MLSPRQLEAAVRMPPVLERVSDASLSASTVEFGQSPQTEARSHNAAARTNLQDTKALALRYVKASLEFALVVTIDLREFFSSLVASEDVRNAREDTLIAAIDFTAILINACFGFLRWLDLHTSHRRTAVQAERMRI